MNDKHTDHTAGLTRRDLLRGGGAAMAGALLAAPTYAQSTAGSAPQAADVLLPIPAWYYQHFDADFALDVPEENFGGWKQETLEFSRNHTAVVLMHAWDAGTCEAFPGWWRCVPYIPRANKVVSEVLPRLLAGVRASSLPLFHVVGGGDYYRDLPGYTRAKALAGEPAPGPGQVARDPIRQQLDTFRSQRVFVGADNAADVEKGFARLDFAPGTRPHDDEGVAENGDQLFALCRERDINHLIYCGFAINWCLLLSPGGMAEMSRHGLMCSALRQAVVAVENKESARGEKAKEMALWRVALAYGFVFDVDPFLEAIATDATGH